MLKLTSIDNQFVNRDDVFPAVIVNDGSVTTIDEACQWIEDRMSDIASLLDKSGAILFRGFPIASAEMFDAFSASFGYPNFTYQDSLSNAVRINFTERVFTANEAPKEVEINLHNEMAQTPIFPDKIFFSCLVPADTGGASPILRGDMMYHALKKASPSFTEQLEQKGVKYTTHMPAEDNAGSGQGRGWKSTLSVSNIDEAETRLTELGYSWEWQLDGSIKTTTCPLPAIKVASNGKKVFFNQLIAAYLGWKGVREQHHPTLRFGDDSQLPKDGLELMCELSETLVFDVEWQAGDVALVDNNLAMHGRRSYDGETKRQVIVALGAAKLQ
ncbi:SyrP protein [Vibrio sp. qd031]|uniref:TauD/TfdA family dioxygenase n=1 Tax=Vibrio sp. qd031 TaxID=1603038 RepID=UPI000A116B0E|nr:TauD/TfdA family dioxygenase [Vibrio sp. qd031]ORT51018.1 SyrP protein [Vibrio sp. qd031]